MDTRGALLSHANRTLDALRGEGRYREFALLEKRVGRFPVYRWRDAAGERDVTVWSTNDYLAMGTHPAVLEASAAALAMHGAGAGGTRNISGTSPSHAALEAGLASWHGKGGALLFGSGYVANQAALSTLLEALPGTWVFSDEKNHASMIAGMRSARGTVRRVWRHNDLAHLEALLREAPTDVPKLVAFESVYSMDGDEADIPAICDLADRYGAISYLDEVHAVGLYGATGAGVAERDGVAARVDVIEGTLAKGIGVLGGYIAGDAALVDLVRSQAAGLIFSTALPPAVIAGALASLWVLRGLEGRALRGRLLERTSTLKAALDGAGLPRMPSAGHIVPLWVGEAGLCRDVSRRLLAEHGIYATAINYPTVPRGAERLRLCATPSHTDEMMETLVRALLAVMPDRHGMGHGAQGPRANTLASRVRAA